MLALNWACVVRQNWEVVLSLHNHEVNLREIDAIRMDLENSDELPRQLRDLSPDMIVHTAGWTDVDGCENNPEKAMRVNSDLASNVAMAAANLGIPLIHISTDHLFGGDRSFYEEHDSPSPVNVYGRSKFQAEQRVLESHPDALVIRTNFFGWGHAHRHSISDRVIQGLRQGQVLNMFEDVFFTPILADSLAQLAHELAASGIRGVVNVAGREKVSKYDFACRLARIFSLPEHYVHRGSIKDNPSVAKRPHDMSLSSEKIKSLACGEPGELDSQIQLLREQEAQGRHAELLGAVHGMNEARPSAEPQRYISYGQHNLDQADINAVTGVLQSDIITQGEKVAEFGQRLADYTGARFGWPVSSGTAALHLSVAALGLGPGDEVITTPMTFCATSNAVLYQGATVRFVDIDELTLNINPELIEAAITPKTKAIIPVDFRGHPAALPQIKELADHHGLKVIEDGAHSIGSSYEHDGSTFNCGDGVHADLCTFSFHPVKHITTGEGGAVMTNDPELHRRVFQQCKHGIDRREDMFSEADRRGSWVYEMDSLGFNYRMTDFQAALGSSQLIKLDAFKRRRREIVDYYNLELSKYEELILPFEESKVDSNFHLYVLRVAEHSRLDRYDLFIGLQRLKYRPMVHYIPVHLLGYYQRRFGYKRGDFPVAERCYDQAISIPLYSSLSDSQVEQCVEDIGRLIKFSEN